MRRIFAILALVLIPAIALAGDEASEKKPDATKMLKKVVRSFAKEKNYQIKLEVRGGFSSTPDHKVPAPRVLQSYEADYLRGSIPVMQVSNPQVIRTPEKGAIRSAGNWMQLLAVSEGAMVERLFSFPHQVIVDAITSGASVSWKASETKKERDGDGLTGVVRDVEVQPNVLLVEVPTKVAIQRYTTIQNSGCTSEG